MPDPQLRGKTALLTGAASGIARAIALALADEGVSLALADIRDTSETAEAACRRDVEVHVFGVDVSDREQARAMVRGATEALGVIDLFVSAAAVAEHEPVTAVSPMAWRRTLATNVEAAVWAGGEVARMMLQRGAGSILFIGSTAVLNPLYTEASYRASKAALKAYAEVLAVELAPAGIRVNVLTPGAVDTPFTRGMSKRQRETVERAVPLGRQAVPEELAPTAVLLLSDALSPYTTGADVIVSGGLHLRPLPILNPDEIRALNKPPHTD